MSGAILGIDADRFDPELLRATDDFGRAVTAAYEQGTEHIEPSHLLVALAEVRGGQAAAYLGRRDIPTQVLIEMLQREVRGNGDAAPPTVLDEQSASPATRSVFADLERLATPGEPIGQRELLAATLGNLEPGVVDLLQRFARIDVAAWAAETTRPAPEAREIFAGPDEEVDLDAFTPSAAAVLETMCREAAGRGRDRLTNPLLLYAMTVAADGLVERALYFLQRDVRDVRERLLALLGSQEGAGEDVALRAASIDAGLRMTLERAAALAAEADAERVGQRELLGALLQTRGGVSAAFFADTGIDVQRLLHFAREYYREPKPAEQEAEQAAVALADVAGELRARVVGQEAVIERLTPHVEDIVLGLELGWRPQGKPAGAFLFCGPSGTGKTMTARVLARLVYGSEDAVLMFEMGQFNTEHSINNFVGAPPGYVGYGEGKLTNGLRDDPRRVVLFDEVEKAHQKVFDALLTLLDEGRISDPAGPVRDARESVIVLTTNLAAKELGALEAPKDEEEGRRQRAQLREILGEFFRPEFLNRVQEAILFSRFDDADLEALAASALRRQAERLEMELGIDLSWTSAVEAVLVEHTLSWRRDEAARGVNRAVEELVQRTALRAIYDARGRGEPPARVTVDVVDGRLAVEAGR